MAHGSWWKWDGSGTFRGACLFHLDLRFLFCFCFLTFRKRVSLFWWRKPPEATASITRRASQFVMRSKTWNAFAYFHICWLLLGCPRASQRSSGVYQRRFSRRFLMFFFLTFACNARRSQIVLGALQDKFKYVLHFHGQKGYPPTRIFIYGPSPGITGLIGYLVIRQCDSATAIWRYGYNAVQKTRCSPPAYLWPSEM